MIKYTDYIVNELTERELLEQLAEEAAELGKAALKLIRARGYSKNKTPITEDEATKSLVEEADDVRSLLFLLGMAKDESKMQYYWKMHRWAIRLGHKENTYKCKITGLPCIYCQPGACYNRTEGNT